MVRAALRKFQTLNVQPNARIAETTTPETMQVFLGIGEIADARTLHS
jgi:hypothetical protein